MSDPKREVFVLEKRAVPYRMARDAEDLLQNVAAGIRRGIPEGEERVVRYVPEPEPRAWILCSERLPKPSEPVWFRLERACDDVHAGWWTEKGIPRWVTDSDRGGPGWTIECATHWMPRIVDLKPEPPHA